MPRLFVVIVFVADRFGCTAVAAAAAVSLLKLMRWRWWLNHKKKERGRGKKIQSAADVAKDRVFVEQQSQLTVVQIYNWVSSCGGARATEKIID